MTFLVSKAGKMTVLLSPARRCLDENAPMYYPFGSKLSRNALLKYKGQEKTIKVPSIFI